MAWSMKSPRRVPGITPGKGRVVKELGGIGDHRARLERQGKRLYVTTSKGSQEYLGKVSEFRSGEGRKQLAYYARYGRDKLLASGGDTTSGAKAVLANPAGASPEVLRRAGQIQKGLAAQGAAYRSKRKLVEEVKTPRGTAKIFQWRREYYAKEPGQKSQNLGGKKALNEYKAEAKAGRAEHVRDSLKARYREGGLKAAVGDLVSRKTDPALREKLAKVIATARESKGSLAVADAIAARRKELAKQLGVKRTTSPATTVKANPGHASAAGSPQQVAAAASVLARAQKGERIAQDALGRARSVLASRQQAAKKSKGGGKR